jgi:hypothetical protein
MCGPIFMDGSYYELTSRAQGEELIGFLVSLDTLTFIDVRWYSVCLHYYFVDLRIRLIVLTYMATSFEFCATKSS